MRWNKDSQQSSVLATLFLSSLVSFGFFAVEAINNHSLANSFLLGNLLLAWIPLLVVYYLLRVLPNYPWLNWRPMLLTFLWLSLLPNSFYLVSDLIHLALVNPNNLLYDSVMFQTFIFNGLILGYLSVYLVHRQLLRRVSVRWTNTLLGLAFFVCSFAIYLGRELRLNSWSFITNPASILFGISSPFINIAGHLQAYTVTLMFFILISFMYVVVFRLLQIFTRPRLPAPERPITNSLADRLHR
jgi:uncharacterized membrane protein